MPPQAAPSCPDLFARTGQKDHLPAHLDKRVQLLVTADGELQVTRCDTLHLWGAGRGRGDAGDASAAANTWPAFATSPASKTSVRSSFPV
eukprot:213022-Chlamydomonas_euryale.AAC.7